MNIFPLSSRNFLERLKTCRHCQKQYSANSYKDQCSRCYSRIKRHGTLIPSSWNRNCESCSCAFISDVWNVKYCKECAYKFRLKRSLTKYRKKNGLTIDAPVRKKSKKGTPYVSTSGFSPSPKGIKRAFMWL
jgi:hypothetical protein